MAAIPFDRTLDTAYARAQKITPMIRKVMCENPSPFTFTGSGTYIVGCGTVAVIDPGPLSDPHVQAVLDAVTGETVSHILVTHTHADHSPAAAPLKEATGAPTYAYGPHGSGMGDDVQVEEDGDMDFAPDVEIRDGDVIKGQGWTMEAVFTPGHTSNHMCFAFAQENALFSGDHVMGWSTTVVSPPDGNMKAYMASLDKLRARAEVVYYPTHGLPIRDPGRFLAALIAHRRAREDQIAACLGDGISDIRDMVARMYVDVDKRLHPAAAKSVLAHLVHMVETGRAGVEGPMTLMGQYGADG